MTSVTGEKRVIIINIFGGDPDKLPQRQKAVSEFNSAIASGSIQGLEVLSSNAEDALGWGIGTLHQRENAVLVTAGDTGKVIELAAKPIIGYLGNVRKTPMVLAGILPKLRGFCVFVDMGGTFLPTLPVLTWSAIAGRVVAQVIFGKDSPTIGFLNEGEEADKGGKIARIRQEIERQFTELGPITNVEPNRIFETDCDVIVTSGFIGNVCIKSCEGTIELIQKTIIKRCKRQPYLLPLAWFFDQLSTLFLADLDWRIHSGAYCLGCSKPVIITHSRCDKKGFFHALVKASQPKTLEIWRTLSSNPLVEQWIES